MLIQSSADNEGNQFRGQITLGMGAVVVFTDDEAHDNPTDALNSVERKFGQALGAVIQKRYAKQADKAAEATK